NQAIVDIADAKARLIDAFILDVITRLAKQDPVLRDLERDSGQQGLATREEANKRLSRIIAVQELQRPAFTISAPLDFETLRSEAALVEPAAHGEGVNRIRLISDAADVI